VPAAKLRDLRRSATAAPQRTTKQTVRNVKSEMTMERRGILIMAAISIAVSTQSYGAEVKQARIAGIYSNLVDFVETGDLLGTEIFIIPIRGNEYVAFYQCWGGENLPSR
jgi:hypothetical protein